LSSSDSSADGPFFQDVTMIRMLPRLGLLGCALLVAARGMRSSGNDQFDFPRGVRWTYDGDADGKKLVVEQEVVRVTTEPLLIPGQSATISYIATRIQDGDTGSWHQEPAMSYLALTGGYLVNGMTTGLPIRIYKLDARQGDSWPVIDPRIRSLRGLKFTHLGEEEITVPAGTFGHARHVRAEIEVDGRAETVDIYIVPQVGIIKTETTLEGDGKKSSMTLELRAFHPLREY
jgi:hypothetical protein